MPRFIRVPTGAPTGTLVAPGSDQTTTAGRPGAVPYIRQWRAMIGARDVTELIWQSPGVSIQWRLSERTMATLTTVPEAGVLSVPERMDEVVVYAQDGVTPIFGGFVLRRAVSRVGVDLVTAQLTCAGFFAYLDQVAFTGSYSGSTDLLDVLADVVAAATDYYLVVHPDQATLGTVTYAFSWSAARATDVLRDLCSMAGTAMSASFHVSVDPYKQVQIEECGAAECAWRVENATPHCVDLGWEDSEQLPYNKVILTCGPATTRVEGPQSWTGADAVVAGTVKSFYTTYPASAAGELWPNVVANSGLGPSGPAYFGLADPLVADAWYWDYANHRLVIDDVTDQILDGDVISILGYTAQLPFEVSADAAETPVRTLRETRTDVTDYGLGQALAAQRLVEVQAEAASKRVTVVSQEEGMAIGRSLFVTYGALGLAVEAMLDTVSLNLITDTLWEWTGSGATSPTAMPGPWVDLRL
jgi:hypothetical protein